MSKPTRVIQSMSPQRSLLNVDYFLALETMPGYPVPTAWLSSTQGHAKVNEMIRQGLIKRVNGTLVVTDRGNSYKKIYNDMLKIAKRAEKNGIDINTKIKKSDTNKVSKNNLKRQLFQLARKHCSMSQKEWRSITKAARWKCVRTYLSDPNANRRKFEKIISQSIREYLVSIGLNDF